MNLSRKWFLVILPIVVLGGATWILVIPFCQHVRNNRRQNVTHENLRAIGVAFAEYEGKKNHFPRHAILDGNGAPLLSWRVEILPFLGQQTLYDQFRLDEPWDSKHNLALLIHMPAVYRMDHQPRDATSTYYQVFVGRDTLFDPASEPLSLSELNDLDGASNTILVAEAVEPVPWTKPEDLNVDVRDAEILLRLGKHHQNGSDFCVLFADGSVSLIHRDVEPSLFRLVITYNDGQPFPFDWR